MHADEHLRSGRTYPYAMTFVAAAAALSIACSKKADRDIIDVDAHPDTTAVLTACQRWGVLFASCGLDTAAATTLLFGNDGCHDPENEYESCLNTCALTMTCDELLDFFCGAPAFEDALAPPHVTVCENACPQPSFMCTDGSRADEDSECDGHDDCPDGSDEHERCQRFPCADGGRVLAQRECDAVDDCADGSDEHAACGHFVCDDGTKIRSSLRCDADGYPDCPDGSDEGEACPHFSCSDGSVVPENAYCDGNVDCANEADEPSSCRFRCSSGVTWIQRARECNGRADCADGSDEHEQCPRQRLCLPR